MAHWDLLQVHEFVIGASKEDRASSAQWQENRHWGTKWNTRNLIFNRRKIFYGEGSQTPTQRYHKVSILGDTQNQLNTA